MRLKITLISILFFMIPALVFSAEATDSKTPAPKAFAPEPVHIFKQVLDGKKVKYDFIIQNKGDADLKIERVKTG